MTRYQALPNVRAQGYQRHSLHGDTQIWIEKNCYVDVVIELLHALQLEPAAIMGSCVTVDFEGDGFTFFKPAHEDLRAFFGVDFQELNVWRPLLDHAREHLGAGKLISTEADAYFLPDTSGTDYRRNHVKTTIIMADLDVSARHLGYFHNASYFELAGEDFEQIFRLNAGPDPTFLPLFAELIRVDRVVRHSRGALTKLALARLSEHAARKPASNPVERFGARFAAELPDLQEKGLAHYHAWAFSTTRQVGAAMELLAAHLTWLTEAGARRDFERASDHFTRLSQGAKTFILKAARSVSAGKPLDARPMFDEMAKDWDHGMTALVAGLP